MITPKITYEWQIFKINSGSHANLEISLGEPLPRALPSIYKAFLKCLAAQNTLQTSQHFFVCEREESTKASKALAKCSDMTSYMRKEA